MYSFLILVVLGLCCCAWAFSSCVSRGYSSLWCTGFSLRWHLLSWSICSRCAGFSSSAQWLNSCGARAQLLPGVWHFPGLGIEPVCPALAEKAMNGTPLQYSCLENLMNRGALWAAVHGVTKSRTRLSHFTFTFHFHALEKEMATQCSCLENPRDRGAWWAAVYGVARGRTRVKRLSSSSSSALAS